MYALVGSSFSTDTLLESFRITKLFSPTLLLYCLCRGLGGGGEGEGWGLGVRSGRSGYVTVSRRVYIA